MLHIHSRIPSRFQNKNYEIKMSDFVLAKSSIVPLVNETKENVIKEAKSRAPVKPILNSSSYLSTNTEVTKDDDDDSDSSNTEDEDNYEDMNRNLQANNEAAGLRQENLNIEEGEDEDTENSGDDENAINDLNPVRPQRASKTEAYRTRLWLRDNESEAEES